MPALPRLIDRAQLSEELFGHRKGGAFVEAIFQRCPIVTVPGSRRVYVRRVDVERLLDEKRSPVR